MNGSFRCGTTALASKQSILTASSSFSRGCTRGSSIPVRGSAWPCAKRSSSATAGVSGSSRRLEKVRPFTSVCRSWNHRMNRDVQILLVEDNPADARLIAELLKEGRLPHQLQHVTDGVEAVDYLRQHGNYPQARKPDLILLDLNLPRKDGRELLAEIKGDDKLKRIPVVVLTTSQAEDDIQ